jgi:hypothetical protein
MSSLPHLLPQPEQPPTVSAALFRGSVEDVRSLPDLAQVRQQGGGEGARSGRVYISGAPISRSSGSSRTQLRRMTFRAALTKQNPSDSASGHSANWSRPHLHQQVGQHFRRDNHP